MNTMQKYLGQSLAVLGIAGAIALGGWTVAAAVEPARDAKPATMQERVQHRQEWIKEKLDKAANRLEIKASQQSAWQAYAKAVESIADHAPPQFPGADADAATMTKFAADKSAEMARKMKLIADATAKLQATLGPEQRKTLDQIVHQAAEHMMHHRFGDMHEGMHEGHEGMDEEHEHHGWGREECGEGMEGMHRHDGHEGHSDHDHEGHGDVPPPPPKQ